MIEEHTYPRDRLPRELEIQILAFMRIVWGGGMDEEDRFRSRLWEQQDAVHFVRAAGDLLVAHVQVSVVHVARDDREVRIGAVGGVMTYPAFRHEGHATELMRRAGAHISERMDVGMLFCDDQVVPFYERLGWRALPEDRVTVRGAAPSEVVMVTGDVDVLPDPVPLRWEW